MSDPFIGEIRTFAGNYAPSGWALCQGQVLPISQNDVLFTLIGTTYGGDGQTTFALPNLAGRTMLHQGTGPGLSPRLIGGAGGAEGVNLTAQQMPVHNHVSNCSNIAANQASPVGNYWSKDGGENVAPYSTTAGSQMADATIGVAGGGSPHNNLQPYLVVNYIIALEGIYPARG